MSKKLGSRPKYQKSINEAAGDIICVKNPSILTQRGRLFQMCREHVDKSGYSYKKKRSRSKYFETNRPKRRRYDECMCAERASEIKDELKALNNHIEKKEKRLAQKVEQKSFDVCDSISSEITELKSKRITLEREFHYIQKSEKKNRSGTETGKCLLLTVSVTSLVHSVIISFLLHLSIRILADNLEPRPLTVVDLFHMTVHLLRGVPQLGLSNLVFSHAKVAIPQNAHVVQVLRQVAVPVLFSLLGLVVVVVVCLLSSTVAHKYHFPAIYFSSNVNVDRTVWAPETKIGLHNMARETSDILTLP